MTLDELYQLIIPEDNKMKISPCVSVFDTHGNNGLLCEYKRVNWEERWNLISDVLKYSKVKEFNIGFATLYVFLDIVIEGNYASEECCEMDGFTLITDNWTGINEEYINSPVSLYGKTDADNQPCFVEVTGWC